MRRRIFHICAFCCGIAIGMAGGAIVFLALYFGLRRLPTVLSVLMQDRDLLPVGPEVAFALFVTMFYAMGTLQPETSKLRPNSRYAISALFGVAVALVFTAVFSIAIHFSPWLTKNPELGRALGQIALMGLIPILPFAARHFAMEIEPGLGYCHHCGYDVRLLDTSQCPECGERVIESVSVRALLKESDLARLKDSRLAVVYLLNPQDRLEDESWVRFVHQIRKNIQSFPNAKLYVVDASQAWVKHWLETSSPVEKSKDDDPLAPFASSSWERVAFVLDGAVLKSVARFLMGLYLSHGLNPFPEFESRGEKMSSSPPAHFPNSFKKSSCIGRPSSLLFPYKH